MQLMAGLNVERLIIAADMLGLAQRAFDDVFAYVKERQSSAPDRPLPGPQATASPISRPISRARAC